MPSALKIFLLSLLAFGAGGYVAFRVAFFIALKLISGEYREPLALGVAALAALLIGTASAVTAGVLAGRNKQP
jgi:hypothetical protein